MLPENDNVGRIDLPGLFAMLLKETPWGLLKAYIVRNAQLHKLCMARGFRMEPKWRDRVEAIIAKEAERETYSAGFCNGFFAIWYPSNQELHDRLEGYFHSDEYAAHRQANSLTEDDYVLPDDKFTEFFRIEDLMKWRILLAFSPLKFNAEQAGRILEDAGGNVVLLERLKQLEDRQESLKKENDRLLEEQGRARETAERAQGEIQDLKRQRRDLQTELASATARFEASQQENRKLRDDLSEAQAARQRLTSQSAEAEDRLQNRLKSEIKIVQKELEDWRQKYEKARTENRDLSRQLATAQEQNAELQGQVAARQKEIAALHAYADLIVSKIDWVKAGQQMKLTTALKRQFNSLVKKLNYETDKSLSLETTLTAFWTTLQEREKALVESIARSNTLEVQSGGIADYWAGLADTFEDVFIGLEARAIMLKMLQEIFYQTLDLQDLDEPLLKVKSGV